jgi:mono/diheme cytochrome c family protein
VAAWPTFGLAAALLLGLAGCSEVQGPTSLPYSTNADHAEKLAEKPKALARVRQLVAEKFGPTTEQMRVPTGAPLPEGGARLAARAMLGADAKVAPKAVAFEPGSQKPIRGGFALYREHCMHCHGASGDGNGPTALFLWPRPRDFRPGVFKFTSTQGTGPDSKPTRDDLRRTIRDGIANTSMSPFLTVMSPSEIEQVIDYVIFLSLRGEIENGLVYFAQDVDEESVETDLGEEVYEEVAQLVFDRWVQAEANVLNPQTPCPDPTPESVERGRRLYLGEKGLQCYGCHGLDGKGNGDSFVDYRSFVRAVFEGNPSQERIETLRAEAEAANKKWSDDWGNPLRPSNLTQGVYKGGRRPIDLYWRIAKGINGTPMPVHLGSQLTSDEEVWDIVNFLRTLPERPDLLKGARPIAAEAAAATADAAPRGGGTSGQ